MSRLVFAAGGSKAVPELGAQNAERESRGGGSGFPCADYGRRGVCVIVGLVRNWRPRRLAPGFHSLQFWKSPLLSLISGAAGRSNFQPTNTAKENKDFHSD